MNPIQARAARYALRYTAKEVAKGSGVSDFTVKRFEKGEEGASKKTIDAMIEFFASKGVVFMDDDRGHGVVFSPNVEIMPPRAQPR